MSQVAINGGAGRMGLRLIALVQSDEGLELAAAIDRADHPSSGQDVGSLAGIGPINIALSDRLSDRVGALIDFSVPLATRAALEQCVATGSNMVIGTTGLTEADQRLIDDASKKIAILQAPNMSLGVNLLFALAGEAARRLDEEYDVEIMETHHRFKKDAPSGTALGIAQAVCQASGRDLAACLVHGRHGDEVTRQKGQVGIHALRSGDVVGRHTVSFATLGEELQLTHIATSRDIFARGALTAAKWISGRPPGRYRIADVLGIGS